MSYKTILVHIDDSPRSAERVAVAARLALSQGAHLLGAAMTGVSRSLYHDAVPDEHDPNLMLHLKFLRERAGKALEGVALQVRALGLESFEQRLVDDEAGGGISLLARYADLVVIGQFDPARPSKSVMSDFPAYVIVHAGRPVLVLPHAGVPGADMGRNVLISWNDSKEAAHAVSAALPLLRAADSVTIAIVDAAARQTGGTNSGDAPGAGIAHYLARHGVRTNIVLRDTAKQRFMHANDVGAALLSLAADLAADLLVMGAYGHSRFRETILGGVTRTVLQHATLPLLMVH